MIRRTRQKMFIVTMSILLTVFIIVGAVAFTIMVNRPKMTFTSGGGGQSGEIQRPPDPELEAAIKEFESRLNREWLLMYSAAATAALVVLGVITHFLSGWVVRPIKEAIEKQRQFVSDASHELKTPISIISANADVLLSEGENKWVENIKTQSSRMQHLTNDLLTLARLDEGKEVGAEKINISEVVSSTVLSFESIAFEAGKTLSTNIVEGASAVAVREEIVRAASILIDNAIKYSNEGASVRVSLTKVGERPMLEVYNSGSGITDSEKNKIFDRFYRADYSRAREGGGNGLGLAILKSLSHKNGWKIATYSNGSSFTAFSVTF